MSDFTKVTLRMDSDDIAWLRKRYRSMGYNKAVRVLVSRHRRYVESVQKQKNEGEENGIELTDADLTLGGGEGGSEESGAGDNAS